MRAISTPRGSSTTPSILVPPTSMPMRMSALYRCARGCQAGRPAGKIGRTRADEGGRGRPRRSDRRPAMLRQGCKSTRRRARMYVLVLRRFFRVLALVGGVCGLVVVGGRPVHAETCQVLRYTFQP